MGDMIEVGTDGKKRCFGNGLGETLLADYHDYEWGVPVYDDCKLFEMLVLEGAQAGLSWQTILKRRENYRLLFHGFDVGKIAPMTDAALDGLCLDASIIRNRLKIYSVRKNARVFIDIQREFGTFSDYLWAFVDGKPVLNGWPSSREVPVMTETSQALSKDLKKRGMSFVGPTIIYAYMQATGLVNDHVRDCWCYGRSIK